MIGTIQGGRYRIVKKLGEGGMGEVYLAEHINLGRHDALKIVHRELVHDPEFVVRFRREARATNRLQHPHIVVIYDFGRLEEGRYFLAMEYADGEPLSHLLRQMGTLEIPRMLEIMMQLAGAIEHAHSRGVIHRDLRPDNIIVQTLPGGRDQIKVLDFGLAKIIAPDYIESVGVSRKGQIFGTPAYMAPEQFQGISDDPRIDIYALGCVAFELITGAPPFTGRPMEIMSAQANKAPDLPSRRIPKAGIPEQLDHLILRCLEKDPLRRFQRGGDIVTALERIPGRLQRGLSGSRIISRRRPPPAPADFDCADTDVTPPPGLIARSFGFEQTPPPTPAAERQDPSWCLALRELAESFLDSGACDVRVVMELARLKEIEDDLARTQSELSAVDSQAGTLEQSARQRESSLRFAIGELAFVRSEDLANGTAQTADLERQIGELERRLQTIAKDLAEELNTLTDKAISLAAVRAGLQEKVDASYGAIEQLLEQALPRTAQTPGIRELTSRLRRLRENRSTPLPRS